MCVYVCTRACVPFVQMLHTTPHGAMQPDEVRRIIARQTDYLVVGESGGTQTRRLLNHNDKLELAEWKRQPTGAGACSAQLPEARGGAGRFIGI